MWRLWQTVKRRRMARPRMPHSLSRWECLAVAKLPDGAQRLYEIELDGYRAEAVKADGSLFL